MGKSTGWVFFDKLSKQQSKVMTLEEAQFAILKMRTKDWERFYIWSNGWASWQILKVYLESDQKNFITNFTPTEMDDITLKTTVRDVLELHPASKKVQKEITKSFSNIKLHEESISNYKKNNLGKDFFGGDLTWSNIKKPDVDFTKINAKKQYDHREQRHSLKIEILLVNKKGRAFRSSSKNISLSGALLEKNVPVDFTHQPFEAVIVNNYTSDKRTSRVIVNATLSGEGVGCRIQFLDLTDAQKNSLHDLLSDYLKQQKNYSQQAG